MDVLPKILNEIRDDPDVDAIVEGRVRGFEPAPAVIHPNTGAVIQKGDARGGTATDPYIAFVVLVQIGAPREIRVPIQRPRIVARCYGRTKAEAAALRWAVSNAIHHVDSRVHTNGLGIYHSWESSGGDQDKDPDTQQPLQTLIIEAVATTQAVGVGS